MDSHLDAVLGRNVSVERHGQDESSLPVSYWRHRTLNVPDITNGRVQTSDPVGWKYE
jgi:hypothetical protein